MRLTRLGLREMVVGSILLAGIAVLIGWKHPFLGVIVIPVWVWLLAFFRDPERPTPTEANLMVSPADGMVSDITDVANSDLLGGPAVRVGIFLSVFNVHVNRAPCEGKILGVTYKKGKFINAMSHNKASEENESNTLVLGDVGSGRPIAVVKQIVGLIARRIICTSKVGDVVGRGDRIGMIKFGSRTELLIPAWLSPEIQVKVGQKVQGALTVIAIVRPAASQAA